MGSACALWAVPVFYSASWPAPAYASSPALTQAGALSEDDEEDFGGDEDINYDDDDDEVGGMGSAGASLGEMMFIPVRCPYIPSRPHPALMHLAGHAGNVRWRGG